MLKKILIAVAVIVGIVVLAVAALFIFSWTNRPKTDKKFLSQLKGEVVFTRSKPGMNSEILKYNFQDQNITKIYQCDGLCEYPKWSEDGKNILFFKPAKNIIADNIYQISSEGKNLRPISDNKQSVNKYPQAENTIIKSGDLFLKLNNQERLIYDAKYDGKFYMGVSDVSWNPDKKYLIFVIDGYIVVADANSNITKLTTGDSPNWKY